MKFSIKDFFSKCDGILRNADLVTCTEEVLNGKLYFFAVTPIETMTFASV